jgi:hypothetical protein
MVTNGHIVSHGQSPRSRSGECAHTLATFLAAFLMMPAKIALETRAPDRALPPERLIRSAPEISALDHPNAAARSKGLLQMDDAHPEKLCNHLIANQTVRARTGKTREPSLFNLVYCVGLGAGVTADRRRPSFAFRDQR